MHSLCSGGGRSPQDGLSSGPSGHACIFLSIPLSIFESASRCCFGCVDHGLSMFRLRSMCSDLTWIWIVVAWEWYDNPGLKNSIRWPFLVTLISWFLAKANNIFAGLLHLRCLLSLCKVKKAKNKNTTHLCKKQKSNKEVQESWNKNEK